MKIKTKLNLGVGILFLLIILLGGVAVWYINALKSDTENILVANYNTLQYSQNMLIAIQDSNSEGIQLFESNLQKQESNITEEGEQEHTQKLRNYFNKYKSRNFDSTLHISMRNEIFKLQEINMQAIKRKSELAKQTANTANVWIPAVSILCFLIAFTLLVNLPSNIADPIKELTESIKQIASKKYSERVNFESHNEFGELAKSFNTMAQKLEEYNNSNLARLMIEKKRIETLINKMHDPVIGLDENLVVLFANEAAISIIGLKFNELIGKDAKALSFQNDLIRLLIKEIVLASSNSPTSNDVKPEPLKIYADSRESYFEKEIMHIAITPTGEKTDTLVGHVVLLRNVTKYKELDFAKTNFIASVSHEFKTPISSIKMSLQLLENPQIGSLNEEQKNLLAGIDDDASRLLKITGELLNMTQVESGNIQLSIMPADPKEILQYAINATKIQASQRSIKIEVNCPDKIPKVQADHEKTAWVLINLISNAIRYSHDNSTVFIDMRQEKNKIQISIKDKGQGVLPHYKEKIFDRYFRIPNNTKEGTGLGLAISKEFVEAQGGSIAVESEFGLGSTFTITLLSVD